MFIWTISDAIQIGILGLVVLFFAGCFAVIGLEKLWNKVSRPFRR